MESLIGYGSDDDYEEQSQPKKQQSSQIDVNYEEVQMDLSEESNDSSKLDSRPPKSRESNSELRERDYADTDRYKKSSEDYKSSRSRPQPQDSKREEKYKDRSRNEDERREESRKEDKYKDYKKDRSRDERNRPRESRKSREDSDKYKDKSYDSYDANKDDRKSHKGSSRERDRHRSRSPRRSDHKRRSNSRDRNRSSYSKRYERSNNRPERPEKSDANPSADYAGTSGQSTSDKEPNRFFMAGITGRFTEQIQRRKMLWQKKDSKPGEQLAATTNVAAPSGKVWQNTTFAQDTDGKVANKFKRLMGIKGTPIEPPKTTNDSLKKQEEMFTSMEAQYEVARTATHTMRGVGLGFGSFQR